MYNIILVECISLWDERIRHIVLCYRSWCVCKWSTSKHVRQGNQTASAFPVVSQPLVAGVVAPAVVVVCYVAGVRSPWLSWRAAAVACVRSGLPCLAV